MSRRIKKYFLISCGLLFVTLGIIGVVLPVLPTIPFLILALSCFANSSPRFHQMLLNNRWFGTSLKQWEESGTVTQSTKRKAMFITILTFTISILVLHGRVELQVFLFTLASFLLIYMSKLKETIPVV